MKIKQTSVWLPFCFSVIWSAIVLIENVARGFNGGSMDAGLPAIMSFLPMCFFFAAIALRDSRYQFKVLEARINQLEAEQRNSVR